MNHLRICAEVGGPRLRGGWSAYTRRGGPRLRGDGHLYLYSTYVFYLEISKKISMERDLLVEKGRWERKDKNMPKKSQRSTTFYDPSIGSLVHKVTLLERTSERSFIPDIPKQIISVVNVLAGKALGVFMVLWRESVMQRSLTVRLTLSI